MYDSIKQMYTFPANNRLMDFMDMKVNVCWIYVSYHLVLGIQDMTFCLFGNQIEQYVLL